MKKEREKKKKSPFQKVKSRFVSVSTRFLSDWCNCVGVIERRVKEY